MEQQVGRVTTSVRVENLRDAWDVEKGDLGADEARVVTIDDALVDTGASYLSLPAAIVKQLGLHKTGEKRVKTTGGPRMAGCYDPVRATILGRDCVTEVMEVPDGVPTLIGQLPLEQLDLVIDPKNQSVTGNPAHGGEWIIEMY